MPSLLHESLVQLVSNCALVVAPLLRGRIALPEGELVAESLSADFSQLTPTEYRADQVIALRLLGAATPAPSLVIIVEIQLAIDPRKRFSWPVYVATAAAKYECEVHLLVLTPDAAVAQWARGPFGPASDFLLHPIVLSYADLPEHLEAEDARRFPELAVLTALAHPSIDNANHALGVVRSLVSERAQLYCDIILKALVDAYGTASEVSMLVNGREYQYQSDFARKYLAQGVEEGLRQGREKLREAEERQLEILWSLAVELARGKLGALPDPLPSALLPPYDAARLSALILELGGATSPEQARDAIDRASR